VHRPRAATGPPPCSEPAPEPAQLAGLLAEPARLRVVAALVLGATTPEEIEERANLDARKVRAALGRLIRGGLVAPGPEGGLRLAEERFTDAARASAHAASARKTALEDLGASDAQARVLRSFFDDGRLVTIPAQRAKRMVLLDFLAGRFAPGQVYPERDVSFELGRFHPDVASLRRHLVDEGFLERRDGLYWRAGGTFEVD
jgi:hypothetical protein